MSSTIAGLAEEFCAAINAGDLDWSDYLASRYDYATLLESFQEQIKENRSDFAEELTSSSMNWSENRIKMVFEGAAVPTNDELTNWAEAHQIDPVWLLLVPLTDGLESRGFAIIYEEVPYCDGGPLFKVEATFDNEPSAIAYLEANWPEYREAV